MSIRCRFPFGYKYCEHEGCFKAQIRRVIFEQNKMSSINGKPREDAFSAIMIISRDRWIQYCNVQDSTTSHGKS